MKIINLLQSFKWISSWVAVFTMVISPVAMGKQAESNRQMTIENMQSMVEQLGLNKQITVGEFFNKNKELFPEHIRKQLEPVFLSFKNQPMPVFEVLNQKGPKGTFIPTLRVSQNGQLASLQWYGEKNKFFKIQNTTLSEVDIVNFDDMFKRIYIGDENIRRQLKGNSALVFNEKKGRQFTTYPEISKTAWKSMTPEQRASYFINMHLMWNDARNVLFQLQKGASNETTKPKKTSSIEKLDQLERLFNFLVARVEAAKTAKTSAATGFSPGKKCIIAGYVTEYSTTKCDRDQIAKNYSGSELYKKAASGCSSSQIACNPIIFGTPGGNPICITPGAEASYQQATHYNGPCETNNGKSNNHLGSEINFLKDKELKKGRYDDDNVTMKISEITEAMRKEQEANGYSSSKDFISGILKFKDPTLHDLFIAGKMDDNLFAKIKEIRDDFNSDIAQARASCIEASNQDIQHEKNFWGACDQLHRRNLFVAELLATSPGCKDNSKMNNDSLRCACPAPTGAAATEVLPGSNCPVVQPQTPPAPAVPSADQTPPAPAEPRVRAESCESQYGSLASELSKDCKCKSGGAVPTVDVTDSTTGAQTFKCGDSSTRSRKAETECGFGCSLLKGLKFIAPVAILLGVGYLIYKAWIPKKPTLKPAPDTCPNGSAPSGTPPICGQSCALPYALQSNGSCACAACPIGQTSNPSTCVCGTTTTTPTLITCPDGVSQRSDLSTCPYYPCWNNHSYQNPMNCPPPPPGNPKPTPTTPTTPATGGKTR